METVEEKEQQQEKPLEQRDEKEKVEETKVELQRSDNKLTRPNRKNKEAKKEKANKQKAIKHNEQDHGRPTSGEQDESNGGNIVDDKLSKESEKDVADTNEVTLEEESVDDAKENVETNIVKDEDNYVRENGDGSTGSNVDQNIEKNDDEDPDDDGDPIPSGTGAVSKDCSASDLLGWSEILPRWHSRLNQRPKGLDALVRNGIPEPLRGEVWQLLSGTQQSSELMDHYRIFLTKTAPTEQIILRDVHRTYPAHENFRTGGSSSLLDSLFKVCKAYAVYDEEVGYCQGLSFLVAALLLHMPEEQAFCVFVRIMKHYGLRDLFRNNFDELYLKFYQLERLLEDHMPDLHQHFTNIGIEPFTYASQWFLTLFTAKFPLNAVFYIMDIFLLDGMNTIFQIALALLSSSKQELLALDFEGVLKYFRVQMPKRYRNQDNVQQLIDASSEISVKKLKKHAKSYDIVKQRERLLENPVLRLHKENAKLTENNLRLEQENDDLARDLVASKIQLRAQLDVLEDKTETLNRALLNSHQDCQGYISTISDMRDERNRLEVEVTQLKEVCRRELHRAESESARDSSIIGDYKRICSQLSKRLDRQIEVANQFIETMLDSLRDNESCNDKLCYQVFQSKAESLLHDLRSSESDQHSSHSNPSENENKTISTTNSPIRKVSAESNPTNRPVGAYIRTSDSQSTSSEVKIQQLTEHIDELEVELARTKLALVEAECKCQQLTHDLSVGVLVKSGPMNSTSTGSGFTGKLDFVKAAMTTRRSPKGGSTAFAKINNLISEKISNISAQNLTNSNSMSPSDSFQSTTIGATSGDSRMLAPFSNSLDSNSNNNATIKTVIDQYQNQC